MTVIAKTSLKNPRQRPPRKVGMDTYNAIAETAGMLHKYQDIPLRLQRQWITVFLTAVVLLTLVAGLYLNVTSRTAIAGREIQNLEQEITVNERINADLQTQIAGLLSNTTLKERAIAAGYVPLERAGLEYLAVPGYFPREGVILVKPDANTDVISMSPQYTESLLSWLTRQMEAASLPLAQTR